MRNLLLVTLIALAGCCGTPSKDYVEAEATAWAQIDPYLDGWIDGSEDIPGAEKQALHHLNVGRRARIAKARKEIADAEGTE